ncbi:MAG: hypothetical protein HXX13_05275 [Bacteroidetes bacterium]|nr:hypothetical protein [Bacteroidota bacterium]
MNINKDNYEAIFLDYHEGVLSSAEVDEMFVFISQHPEVKQEFEEFEMISIQPDTGISFAHKESLKKNMILILDEIGPDNYEEFLISEMEGSLNDEQLLKLTSFMITHPEIEKEKRLFSHTKLTPDLNIQFQQKENLLHSAISFGEINETNFEDYFISQVEGSLSVKQESDLREFLLLNPELERSHKITRLTRLQPDTSVVFEDKSSLRKAVAPIRRLVLYSLSAAASIILLAGIYFRFQENQIISTANNNPINHSFTSSTKNTKFNISKQISIPGKSVELASNKNHQTSLSRQGTPDESPSISLKENSVDGARELEVVELLASRSYKEISSHDYVAPEFIFIRTSQMHTNDYMELYYNVRLAEQIQYAQLNQKDENPERTILSSMTAYASNLFKRKNNDKNEDERAGNSGISVWTFAELGVKTYNKIAQDNVTLDLQRDEEGKVISYNLLGDRLDLQRDINK